MTFGEYLRQLREQAGIGLRELSRRAKLSTSHIHYLENDQRSPGDATLKKLAPILGTTAKELIAARDERKTETELTLLLKEAREAAPLTDEQRGRLLEIAHEVLNADVSEPQQ